MSLHLYVLACYYYNNLVDDSFKACFHQTTVILRDRVEFYIEYVSSSPHDYKLCRCIESDIFLHGAYSVSCLSSSALPMHSLDCT